MLKTALKQFGFNDDDCLIEQFGSGLINSTWLVAHKQKKYILQRINHNVFIHPEYIASNIRAIGDYLKKNSPNYLFVNPCKALDGSELVTAWESYFRLFPFIEGSRTIDVVQDVGQAYEAAKQFGRFAKLLSGFDTSKLEVTLPDFHDLSLRYKQFEHVLKNGNSERIRNAHELISFIREQKQIVNEYEYCREHFKIRCTHHDTKISNVLFDSDDKGLCVIDLDTVMPGYFISDVGDMMRTYLSPVNEEETDLSKIRIRKEFYHAIFDGYMSEMEEELSDLEKKHFNFAGAFMIYMQAIRFLSDHLNNDNYYGAKYEGHNFARANNQVVLLKQLLEFNPY